MIHLLVIALLAVSTWADFECPPAGKIFPCECFSNSGPDGTIPVPSVQCDNVTNFAILQIYIGGRFSQTIPRLRLTGMQTFSVPARALGDLSVQRLVLRDSYIRRIDKDAFEGQAAMEHLVLANNMFEDIPTEALQHLNSLQSLNLENNFLTRVPDRAFENLNDLMYLKLPHNRISEIYENAFPKNVKLLYIEWNHLTTLNGSLNGLEHLEKIYASDNRLMNISGEFDDLPNLKVLSLDRNSISDISDTFLNVTSITGLSLSRNRIEDVGISLMNLSKLRYLNISYNYITQLHWRMFEKLKDLQILDLSGNYLKTVCPTVQPLKFLHKHGLDCFHNMKSLWILDLSYNRLVNIDAISRHPLPALMSLRLDHNQLSALGKEMTYAKNLRELDISYNNFTSLNASYLSHNEDLAFLKMEGNPWNCTEEIVRMVRDLEERGVAIQGRPDCSTESKISHSVDK